MTVILKEINIKITKKRKNKDGLLTFVIWQRTANFENTKRELQK